ncbi:MAG: alcohol dehydrogenase [Planctomycetota bacterium]|nr:MAG: alcohol dehydrogenase [Planctomycetota bacterium]
MAETVPPTMRALVFEDGKLRFEAGYPVPGRPPGEARIKVTCAGLCATDLAIFNGYMDFAGVPGHEFVGVVVEADGESLTGKRVVGGINAACMKCEVCNRGDETHCPDRTVLGIQGRDGAFAEYLLLPERTLVPVPDEVPDEAAVFSEPIAAALHILDQVTLPDSKLVAVIGDGRLGLLVAQVMANSGCTVDLYGRHPERVKHLSGSEIKHHTGRPLQDRYDLVVECSGSPDGLEAAYGAVRPLGTLVMKSTCAEPVAPNPWQVVVKEINVVGSRCGDVNKALPELAAGRIKTGFMIEEVWTLAEAADKLNSGAATGKLKILIKP